MSDTPSLPQLSSFGRDILSSKEKMVGAIVTVCLIGAVLIGINALLPGINHFLSGMLAAVGKIWMLAISMAGLALFLAVAMSKRTHNLLRLAFHILARKTTMAFVRYSPTTIIEIYANEYLDKRGQQFGQRKTLVDSKRGIVAQAIDENDVLIRESETKATSLKSRHYDERKRRWDSIENQNLFTEYATDIKFRSASNENLRKQLKRLEFYLQILNKFELAFNHRRNVIRNFVKILKTEYEAMKASAEATRELTSVFGTDDMKTVFEMTVDFMKERIAFFTSEVDNFMSENMRVVTELDLDNEVAEDALLNRLSTMDQKADLLISQATEDEDAITDPHRLASLVKSRQASNVCAPIETPRKRRLLGS